MRKKWRKIAMQPVKSAPFGLTIRHLGDLVWTEITFLAEDGRSWRVKEIAAGGSSFRLHVSGKVCEHMGLGAVGEKITDETIKPVLMESIVDYLTRFGIPSKGQEVRISVDVAHFRNVKKREEKLYQ